MVTWYWSADTVFWQMSIDHNMDVQYQRSKWLTKAACLRQPIIWRMAAILRDSVTVVVVVVRTRPRTIPLAMITMRKFIDGFPFPSHMSMGLRLAARSAKKLQRDSNLTFFVCLVMPTPWIVLHSVQLLLLIVSITKFSIAIGSPRAYLSRNRRVITFCNRAPVMGYPRDFHANYTRFIGFLSNVFYSFQNLGKALLTFSLKSSQKTIFPWNLL